MPFDLLAVVEHLLADVAVWRLARFVARRIVLLCDARAARLATWLLACRWTNDTWLDDPLWRQFRVRIRCRKSTQMNSRISNEYPSSTSNLLYLLRGDAGRGSGVRLMEYSRRDIVSNGELRQRPERVRFSEVHRKPIIRDGDDTDFMTS